MEIKKVEDIINNVHYDLNEVAAKILTQIDLPGGENFYDIIGMYDSPYMEGFEGDIYLVSSAVPVQYQDRSDVDQIIKIIEKKNKQTRGLYMVDYEMSDEEDIVWVYVLFPIGNWFNVK